MADNVKVLPSTDGTAVNVATDDIAGVHYPIYKHAYGADGSVTLVDATNRLPVDGCVQLTFRYDVDATYKWFGEAQPGTATSAASWRIIRMTIADKTMLYADGDSAFDNVWDDHSTTVVYS